ncbi:MAG: hypothetical protein AUI14_07675 [Actinobacteria bacterium 13_2_20CM_2_71_6]|nr:MAG: hypothetical protein AUI14_07675 [Actinobacteria bacterium 13_2_20CM_2_71_6]
MSRSQMTRVRTPLTTFARSLTMNTTLCGVAPPPRFARPSSTYFVPGTSGRKRLSSVVGYEKLPRWNGTAVAQVSGSACLAAGRAALGWATAGPVNSAGATRAATAPTATSRVERAIRCIIPPNG